jgi:hypothetical protein
VETPGAWAAQHTFSQLKHQVFVPEAAAHHAPTKCAIHSAMRLLPHNLAKCAIHSAMSLGEQCPFSTLFQYTVQ